ncbi:hypothetical protein GWN26_08440 [Candidatus Saccharibacteria bacterium]|nr:hypothetical protein [Candidatus Saccharibacteria bacterium]NIV03885.1 hypothetical protein [Calditrichia bacterium]NIS38450.1 hypothetical protein [Candidatus Saccharibacteria bacterium]NIV72218.1 hypothetical protein [Calditrichia bacterium]NIV99159.1 hypothetical protein [Candidatus Saccharibacteria bacterium]
MGDFTPHIQDLQREIDYLETELEDTKRLLNELYSKLNVIFKGTETLSAKEVIKIWLA